MDSSSFIGEIRAFPYRDDSTGFVPYGWLACDGRPLDIRQYQALFSIIGRIYGGDMKTYFNLPDLRGTTAIGFGQKPGGSYYQIGEHVGFETVTLNNATIPPHTHTLNGATGDGALRVSAPESDNQSYLSDIIYQGAGASKPKGVFAYLEKIPNPVNLSDRALTPYRGGSNPHQNCSPFLALRYCICWDGDYPQFQ